MRDPVAFRRAIEAARAEASEVRLATDDREAIERVANDRVVNHEHIADEPPRKRRRSSFIGLRAR